MKQRNNSIDIFRYVCALMVVAIHAHPFCELGVNADFFFSTLLPRIAVPFFFAASGYFYIKKLESGTERCFSRYLKRIITTYALWIVIYFIFTFCKGGYSALKWFAVSSVYNFFVKGSYYHFWFFPALIISVCLITVFYKMNLKKLLLPVSMLLYIIGCIGCAYHKIGVQIPLLRDLYESEYFTIIRRIFMMGFPFFACGKLIDILEKKLNKSGKAKIFAFVAVTVVIWLAEIFAVQKRNLSANIIITFGLYPMLISVFLLLLRYPLPNCSKIASIFRTSANFTFYSHPIILELIKMIYAHTVSREINSVFLYSVTVILTFAASFALQKLNNKFLNKFIQ